MKKSHIVFCVLALCFFAVLEIVTKSLAARGDIQTFKEKEVEVYRLQTGGIVNTSSGMKVTPGLAVIHEDFIDLPRASATAIINPVFAITTTTALNNSTTYINGPLITQPGLPRTIEILIEFGSGTAIVKGTDTFNNQVTENFNLSSGVISYGKIPFAHISSITISIASVSAFPTHNARFSSSVIFNVGSSTGIGLSYRLDLATDIVKASSNYVSSQTFRADHGYNTMRVTDADASRDYRFWYLTRRSIFVPK